MKRCIVLILDGVGIGELPDAAEYHDQGSNTLGNLARICGGLDLPVLESMGLGNIENIMGVERLEKPIACFGKMAEKSPGKDSTSGHWELFGIVLNKPFPLYPKGFPDDIIREFVAQIGHGVIGNFPASGTEIIKDLGAEHIKTKKPIVYTSADSVFQIACHTDIFALKELYEFCHIARHLLQGKHGVARVIARPFAGKAPNFYRTKDRRDFSLPPPQPTLLDLMKKKGFEVIVIGKVDDIVANQGYTRSYHSVNNRECVKFVLETMQQVPSGLIVANFVQFDMDWGHRNDIEGFKNGLIEIDQGIGLILSKVADGDAIFVTADHGNDPTTPSTDHSREYVPILAYSSGRQSRDLGIRKSFSDLAQTIAQYFDIKGLKNGEAFLDGCTA